MSDLWPCDTSSYSGQALTVVRRCIVVGWTFRCEPGARTQAERVSAKNSWRERASSRSTPCTADVIVFDPPALTPRMDMHMCSASITTPTSSLAQHRIKKPRLHDQ